MNLSPRPGAAPLPRMVAAQAAVELRLTLRRGESLLLTLGIPVALLLFLARVPVGDVDRAELVPGLLALAVLSTAMTGLAIATGFERQYGVLKRLGATPLPRTGLLAAKALSVAAVEVVQAVALVSGGLLLGWRPPGSVAPAAEAGALVLLGTAAFAALGMLLAGTLRAEATLAAANALYLGLLLGGGVVVPSDRLPGALQALATGLPSAALGDGLRAALAGGTGVPIRCWAVLAAWTAVAGGLAARTFRWD